MEALLTRLKEAGLSDTSLSAFIKSFAIRTRVEKNTIIVDKGDKNDRVYFIEKGLICCYKSNRKRIYPHWIRKEDDFFGGMYLYERKGPSDITIVALEASELISITYAQYKLLEESEVEFSKCLSTIMRQYSKQIDRHRKLLLMSQEMKFYSLLKSNPDLFQRVPLKYLAHYMMVETACLKEFLGQRKFSLRAAPNVRRVHLY
jgi:CRP-like cAMP-binding protein